MKGAYASCGDSKLYLKASAEAEASDLANAVHTEVHPVAVVIDAKKRTRSAKRRKYESRGKKK